MTRKFRPIKGRLTLKHFTKGTKQCYNRTTQSQLPVVDTHLHLRPFGGDPIPFKKMVNILRTSGIIFAEAEGIGQQLPINSSCTYYLDCPHVDVVPSIKNDIANALSILENNVTGIQINLSMTFPDLSKPNTVLPQMKDLENKFPGMFRWMGEVNLVKQALFKNGHKPVDKKTIAEWSPFMRELQDKNFPISIHCDLGNNNNPFKYLPLMQEVLKLYPNNKVVWMHLGLSMQLTRFSRKSHILILDQMLSRHNNLYFDISWSVLYKQEFNNLNKRASYVKLLNKWPRRFLPGTDFISAIKHNARDYKQELKLTGKILKDVNNDAFRGIALGQNYLDLLNSKYIAPKVC